MFHLLYEDSLLADADLAASLHLQSAGGQNVHCTMLGRPLQAGRRSGEHLPIHRGKLLLKPPVLRFSCNFRGPLVKAEEAS